MQEWDDLIIVHSLSADFISYLTNPDPPAKQELSLTIRNVLIQSIHDLAISGTNLGA
jgi:hypothetical protein